VLQEHLQTLSVAFPHGDIRRGLFPLVGRCLDLFGTMSQQHLQTLDVALLRGNAQRGVSIVDPCLMVPAALYPKSNFTTAAWTPFAAKYIGSRAGRAPPGPAGSAPSSFNGLRAKSSFPPLIAAQR